MSDPNDPNEPKLPYVNIGPGPCPEPDEPKGLVFYQDNGKAAIWYDGNVYIKDNVSQPVQSHWTH